MWTITARPANDVPSFQMCNLAFSCYLQSFDPLYARSGSRFMYALVKIYFMIFVSISRILFKNFTCNFWHETNISPANCFNSISEIHFHEWMFHFMYEIHASNNMISQEKFWTSSFHKWFIYFIHEKVRFHMRNENFMCEMFQFDIFFACESTCEIFVGVCLVAIRKEARNIDILNTL